jgi:glyoxylase-like metal-dependent hydrolase (beta-lactamase superfamily II)
MTAYLASLRRLRTLDLVRILPGHGAPIERPYEEIDEYLAHRLLRERQIVEALAAGVVTVPAIVARIYADLAPVLLGAAAATVRAHLEKLIRDGVAVEEAAQARYRLA